LVAQLLEPAVVVVDRSVETLAAPVAPPLGIASDPVLGVLDMDHAVDPATDPQVVDGPRGVGNDPRAEHAVASDAAPAGDRDSGPARIPVFDLDRLRWWLTDGEVVLGRIAVLSVEIDNLARVNERLGDKAGAQLIEAITS